MFNPAVNSLSECISPEGEIAILDGRVAGEAGAEERLAHAKTGKSF
jgi:hypothetical protein